MFLYELLDFIEQEKLEPNDQVMIGYDTFDTTSGKEARAVTLTEIWKTNQVGNILLLIADDDEAVIPLEGIGH